MQVIVRVALGGAGVWLIASTGLSAVKTVVVPRAISSRISRTWFTLTRRVFERIANERRPFVDRDRVLSLYAPLSLVLLPGVWVTLVVSGFTAVQWAILDSSLREAFLVSGSSMLTLGVRFHADLASATASFVEATMGLGLVALLISYLPSLYGSFARREAAVAMLEVRAGTPPHPGEMLVRYWRIGMLSDLDEELFPRWEQWFVEVEESHSSLAALNFFRSPQPERSWITAAGCVLDTASIYLSVLDVPRSARAAISVRTGFLALRRIADLFHLPYDADPHPGDPISVSRREFDEMVDSLAAAGVPVKPDRDQAWLDFAGWRVNYDEPLVLLAKLLIAPDAHWSTDRTGPRLVPKVSRRRNHRQRNMGRVIGDGRDRDQGAGPG